MPLIQIPGTGSSPQLPKLCRPHALHANVVMDLYVRVIECVETTNSPGLVSQFVVLQVVFSLIHIPVN